MVPLGGARTSVPCPVDRPMLALSGFGHIGIALVAWSHRWIIIPLQLNNARSFLLGFLYRYPYVLICHCSAFVSRGAMLHLLQDNILGLRL